MNGDDTVNDLDRLSGVAVAPLPYAAPPPAAGRTLRRLVVLNAVIGPLLIFEYPAIIASAFLYDWYAILHHARWPTIHDFVRSMPDNASDFLPRILSSAVAGLAALASATAINRRRWRAFSIVAGFAMCLAFPFGTIAGLPTAMVLMRRSSGDIYAGRDVTPAT